ncbi:MAG TPA: ComEC/Rec2 family competence protein [Phycisphaerae bacterium]|nr:ComEC/Rec2 family competence protein [Phycisphaerae bacterium]HNU45834.1 ComEC/Rec2 family competence protein [Phycisphaerae bacterium]
MTPSASGSTHRRVDLAADDESPRGLGAALRAVEQRVPLLPVAAGLATGVALDHSCGLDPRLHLGVFGLAALGTCLPALRCRAGTVLIFLVAMAAGGLRHYHELRYVPPDSVARYAADPPVLARITGTVADPPRLLTDDDAPFKYWMYRTERTVFLLDVDSIQGDTENIPVRGRLRVTVNQGVLDLHELERVELFGMLAAPRPPANPGAFDWASYYRRQGIVAGFRCEHRESIRRLAPPRFDPAHGFLSALRRHARAILTDDLAAGAPEEASFLQAMIIGHRTQLDRHLNDVFIRSGLMHFLAVSGSNVGLVMLITWGICRMLMLRRRRATWIVLAAVILYVAVTEPRPPILRAGLMGVLYCIALLLRRPHAALNAMGAGGTVLILVDPANVFDAGFLLSFAAVLGMICLGPASGNALRMLVTRLRARRADADIDAIELDNDAAWDGGSVDWDLGKEQSSFGRSLARPLHGVARAVSAGWRAALASGGRLLRGMGLALGLSICAWLPTAPITACYFGRLQPWGAPNTLLVYPLIGVTMFLGNLKLLVGIISPTAASLLTPLLTWTDALLIWIVERLAELPWSSLTVPAPPAWVMAPYYAWLAALAWLFAPPARSRATAQARDATAGGHAPPEPDATRLLRHRICAAALVAFALAAAAWCWPRPPGERLALTVLAVGPGSASVLELPDGRVVLFDAGSSRPYDVGAHVVVPFLLARGHTRVDRVYVSHPNVDHFSGLPGIVDTLPTGPVVINERFELHSGERSAGRHLLELLHERGHPVEVLDNATTRWSIGPVTFERIWPPPVEEVELDANDSSTVLRVTYAGHSVLLTGDIEEYPQRLLATREDIAADVLVLPHHGSVRPSTGDFVAAVKPQYVIRSSAQRLADAPEALAPAVGGAELLSTADHGAIRITVDRTGVYLRSLGGATTE